MRKRFGFRLLLFLAPLLAAFAAELFVLPIDAFTFRAWEALRVRERNRFLRGYFYPLRDITTVAEGDLGFRTPYARRKTIRFRTDRFGYRNTPPAPGTPEIVLVGDSFLAGGSLTQTETPAAVLAARLGTDVYAYAPAAMRDVLGEARFWQKPPKLVIFGEVERNLYALPPALPSRTPPGSGSPPRLLSEVAVCVDRMRKQAMLHAARARIAEGMDALARRLFRQPRGLPRRMGTVEAEDGSMLFFQGEAAFRPLEPERVRRLAERLRAYRDAVAARGASFLFVPLPNKESIYFDRLGRKTPPSFLPALLAAARAGGVAVADVQTLFLRERENEMLYQVDDTHWSARGAALAAGAIAEAIRGMDTADDLGYKKTERGER